MNQEFRSVSLSISSSPYVTLTEHMTSFSVLSGAPDKLGRLGSAGKSFDQNVCIGSLSFLVSGPFSYFFFNKTTSCLT